MKEHRKLYLRINVAALEWLGGHRKSKDRSLFPFMDGQEKSNLSFTRIRIRGSWATSVLCSLLCGG